MDGKNDIRWLLQLETTFYSSFSLFTKKTEGLSVNGGGTTVDSGLLHHGAGRFVTLLRYARF